MQPYLDLLSEIARNGIDTTDRSGVGTRSVFGTMTRYDLTLGFPMVTTRSIRIRAIVGELLWMLRGETNTQTLEAKIWDQWALKEDQTEEVPYQDFERLKLLAQKRYDQRVPEGEENGLSFIEITHALKNEFQTMGYDDACRVLEQEGIAKTYTRVIRHQGEIGDYAYGGIWRRWPTTKGQSIDQITSVLNLLKTKPDSRRIIVSGWNPEFLPEEGVDHQTNIQNGKQVLPPCHLLWQLKAYPLDVAERLNIMRILGRQDTLDAIYDRLEQDDSLLEMDMDVAMHWLLDEAGCTGYRLSLLLFQRSCDLPVGGAFNIPAYALLTHLIAREVGMLVGDFVHMTGDTHIYHDQLMSVQEQLKRTPRALPQLKINSTVSMFELTPDDIELEGYDPHDPITYPVAT